MWLSGRELTVNTKGYILSYMPYKNLELYKTVLIRKDIYDRVILYAKVSKKPINKTLMELITVGIDSKVGDKS